MKKDRRLNNSTCLGKKRLHLMRMMPLEFSIQAFTLRTLSRKSLNDIAYNTDCFQKIRPQNLSRKWKNLKNDKINGYYLYFIECRLRNDRYSVKLLKQPSKYHKLVLIGFKELCACPLLSLLPLLPLLSRFSESRFFIGDTGSDFPTIFS